MRIALRNSWLIILVAVIGLSLPMANPARGAVFAFARGTRTPTPTAPPTATATPPPATATATPAPATAPRVAAAAGEPIISVPGDVATLQAAITQVVDGGIIELAAGTYASPAGGFTINDIGKGFTIRAAAGATVVLDGGGVRDVLHLLNSSLGAGRPITFERLVFANGRSTSEGAAGGVTMQRARATFRQCTFQNNRSDAPSTGGGGLNVAINSTVFFFDCTWSGNIAKNYGGGMAIQQDSAVFIHRGTLLNNRTNAPNHSIVAAGGAIHVGNSVLRVSNSRFEGNRAGYAGGGIFAIGNWLDPVSTPRADVLIVNSTFVDNQSVRDASVSFSLPTEAGAVHIEDQARGRVYNSRFSFNSAHTGGAINTYRGILDIEKCVFEGNRATGTGSSNGFGGAVMALSNDANDATTNGGTINRRSASLTVRDTLIRGRAGTVTTVGQIAGGIYITGDVNRVYGINGVGQQGTVASNRATLVLDRVAIVDCDVTEAPGAVGSGVAGGLMTSMTALTMTNSLVINNDAIGTTNASGGGMALIDQTAATITGTTIARNSASQYGGGMFVQGSSISVDSCQLIENEVSPGVSEAVGASFGAAILAGPSDSQGLPATGTVSNSLISNNVGLAIYDDDRTNGPINDVRYNGNRIYSTSFGTTVYTNSIPGQCCKSVGQLNTLVVTRSNGTSTDKSAVDNTAPASAPVAGAILGVPPLILPDNAVGDAAPPTAAYLAYAWSGAAATLDGGGVTGNAGLGQAPGTGAHVLSVGGTPFGASIDLGAAPAATFSATPTSINPGQTSTLSWATTAGTFLEAAVDQGVSITSAASGSSGVTPSSATTYQLYDVAEEGGTTGSAMVTVNGAAPLINSFTANPVLIDPSGNSAVSWSTSNATSVRVNGTAEVLSGRIFVAPATTTVYVLTATNTFGSATATVTVNVDASSGTLAQPTITAPGNGQTLVVSGVSLAWDAVGGATGYDLRLFDASSGALVFSGSLSGNGSTSTLLTLPQDGSYLFAVRACNGGFADAQCSRFTTRGFNVALATPSGVPTVTAPANGATLTGSVQSLSWTGVSSGMGLPVFYEVELVHLTSGATELRLLLPDPTLSTVTKLRSGTYRLRVRACQVGCGPYSSAVDFTAAINPVPSAAPTVTSAILNGGNSLTATWTAVAGAEWYQVYVVQPPPAGPGGGALTVAAREVYGSTSVTLPVPIGAASVVAAACNGNGCGPFSVGRSVTPAGPNPAAPQLGQPLAGSTVSGPVVLFTWSRVPGDNGSNTLYRLFVQDLSRQGTAFDVYTTQNYYAAYFKAEGARYDALVIANPGPAQVMGPAVGFVVAGASATAPTMVQPPHNSTVAAGNVQLGWSPVPNASLYEYYVAIPGAPAGSAHGVTPGLFVQVPLAAAGGQPTLYSGIVRACPAGATCVAGDNAGWGPWSNQAGPGVTNFTVIP